DDAVELADVARAERSQALDDLADEDLRRRGAGGDADTRRARQPLATELVGAVDHVRTRAAQRRDLAQAVGVRARRAADDDDDVDRRGDRLDRVLAILRRVADIVAARADDRRKARLE